MNISISRFLAFATTVSHLAMCFAGENSPTLEVNFDGPQAIEVDGRPFRLNGSFVKADDGKIGLAIGKDGIGFPVANFLGDTGTIVYSFMNRAVNAENSMSSRSLLTVRGEGRETILFYQLPDSEELFFAFKLYTDSKSLKSLQPIEPDRWYQAACTWDGTTVHFFLDGILQGEMPQPYNPRFSEESRIYFGPFTDGSINPASWGENSCLIGSVRLYAKALPPEEIAALAGVAPQAIREVPRSFLVVPRVAVRPKVDGELNDDAWHHASSLITLIDGQKPETSLAYRDNNPIFCHDGKTLYVGFRAVFPENYNLLKGLEKTSEVWPDESFEFYLEVNGVHYRFGGNVAGGHCEGLIPAGTFTGTWQYRPTLSTEIDSSRVWQGEIAIPFESLGLSSPEGKEIRANFCRTWRGLPRVGSTSWAGGLNYHDRDRFATLMISTNGTAFRGISINDPGYGTLEQKAQVYAGRDESLSYTITLQSSGGIIPDKILLDKTISIKSGMTESLDSRISIESNSYDTLLFHLKNADNSEPIMRQAIPFKLVDNYLDVVPVFGSEKLLIRPRYGLAKSKAGDAPLNLEVVSPDGKVLRAQAVTSNDEITVPFVRTNPAGTYHALLSSSEGGTQRILTDNSFHYPGVAPWDEPYAHDERVIPPFEPLTVSRQGEGFDIGMWGRVYRYANSLLPETITALKQPVSSAAALYVNGATVEGTLKVTKSSPARVELAGVVNASAYDLDQKSWIEYDGVLWNTISLKAKEELSNVELKIAVPDAVAKFYHAAAGGFGAGGGRTRAITADLPLPFYPVVWVGDQERGISWFAESDASWKTASKEPIQIIREKGETFLKIRFADKLVQGENLAISFGLLATPVKPLPPEYPFTMFGDQYAILWNPKAPRAPVTAFCLKTDHFGYEELGNGFYDLPLEEARPTVKMRNLIADVKEGERNNAVLFPYQAAIFLPEEYPEVKDNAQEWQIMPENNMTYKYTPKDTVSYVWYNCCPASKAADFYLWKFRKFVKETGIRGIYYDFGLTFPCSNSLHGCNGGYPLLAKREFFKRAAEILSDANDGKYAIVVHNSEAVQIPVFTFVTHFVDGEQLRQMSSNVYHFGKSLLDHYSLTDFAVEQSSLPWGITASIYSPTDPLLPQFGGDKEGGSGPQELYRFRMTKAVMAGALIHNTIPSQSRNHYGLFDKVIRFYDSYGVDKSEFLPYWRNQDYVRVLQGKDVYVSLYRNPKNKEILAVVSHVSKEHLDQDVVVEFMPEKLGFKKLTAAAELLTGPDPEYDRLYADTNRLRNPVELGDFGVEFGGLEGNKVKLKLKHQSFGILKISGEKKDVGMH